MLSFLLGGLLLLLLVTLYSPPTKVKKQLPPFFLADTSWAEGQLREMSFEQQLAQLLLLLPDTSSSPDSTFLDSILFPSPGGLVMAGQSPSKMWEWQQNAQARSLTPLLMGSMGSIEDAAWLDVADDQRLGAIQNMDLIQEWGIGVAQQYRDWGYQLYFLPGQSEAFQSQNRRDWVMRYLLLVQGLQQNGILASVSQAKVYFPLETDSVRRDSLLWPYYQLGNIGTSSLTLHSSSVQRIKWNSQRHNIIGSYLQGHAEYKGLLFSRFQSGSNISMKDQLLQMVKAGSDMILLPASEYQAARRILTELVKDGELGRDELKEKVRKILLAKTWSKAVASAQRTKNGQTNLPIRDTVAASWLNHRLAEASITVVKNQFARLPLHTLQARRTHLVSVGMNTEVMRARMGFYLKMESRHLDWKPGERLPKIPSRTLIQANPLLLVLPNLAIDTSLDPAFWEALRPLRKEGRLLIVQYGDLAHLQKFAEFPTLLHAYRADSIGQEVCAQVICGGISPAGILPLQISPQLAYGQGQPVPASRLAYLPPIAAKMKAGKLAWIDSVMLEGMDASAIPGGQVLVAKSGKVIYHKAFGYHTFQERRPVKLHDLYDIASVTKIAATTLAAMKMVDDGKLSLNQRLERFFVDTKIELPIEDKRDTVWLNTDQIEALAKDSNHNSLFSLVAQRESNLKISYDSLRLGDSLRIIRSVFRGSKRQTAPLFRVKIGDLLTHYSGLPAGLPILPFLRYRSKSIGKYDKYYKPAPSEKYTIQVAGDFYLRDDYRDSLWQSVRQTIPAPHPDYEYSDLNMILVQRAIDSLNREPIDLYLDRTFYQPLGLQQTVFLPREKVETKRIIPTEYDARWRGQLLRGYVHDPTAALMGGIAGNAGLFSNANDLAILFQLLLNGGTYGGKRYLEKETIDLFTETRKGHRAYGFDKPPERKDAYIIAPSASAESYGHTGFTGTCVWVDPENDLVFVFLSNRVHPKSNNWKLNEMRIRQRVHEAVYQALP